MSDPYRFLPLLDADEIRSEIAETDAELDALLNAARPPVDREQFEALRERKLARRAKLVRQLEAMA